MNKSIQIRRQRTKTMIVFLICFANTLYAERVSLSWDSPSTYIDGTPFTDLSGYRVYHGLESGHYTEHIDMPGTNTLVTITNLQAGMTHWFAVTALNSGGNESTYSEETSFSIPISFVVTSSSLSIAEGTSASFHVCLSGPPLNTITATVSRIGGGNRYIGVTSGITLVFSPSDWASNRTVTLLAIYDPDKNNREADFECSGEGIEKAIIHATAFGQIQTAPDAGDGNDSDGNGIPDTWEITHFGGVGRRDIATDGDFDCDRVSNKQEFIAGTDPADPKSFPRIQIAYNGNNAEIFFNACQASGTGYMGKSRYYTLEKCTNPRVGDWQEIPSAKLILAHNQTVAYTDGLPETGKSYYRSKITLQ